MWASIGDWYCANIEVIVERSGWVPWLSHCIEPTREQSFACSLIFSGGEGAGAVAASTGRPVWYGVSTGLDELESSTRSTELSANAV